MRKTNNPKTTSLATVMGKSVVVVISCNGSDFECHFEMWGRGRVSGEGEGKW